MAELFFSLPSRSALGEEITQCAMTIRLQRPHSALLGLQNCLAIARLDQVARFIPGRGPDVRDSHE